MNRISITAVYNSNTCMYTYHLGEVQYTIYIYLHDLVPMYIRETACMHTCTNKVVDVYCDSFCLIRIKIKGVHDYTTHELVVDDLLLL